MSPRPLLNVIGLVVAATGIAMILAALTSAVYGEWADAAGIAAAAAIAIGAGLGARWVFPTPTSLSARQGFAIVGLAWFAISLFGMLPMLLTGAIGNVTDAFFQASSMFTTTSSSVLSDPAALGHGVILWMALAQWLGGMGIIVLSIAVLPLLGVGGVQLARAEAPGPTTDRLTPRFAETAKRLWMVYAGLTAVQALLLVGGEMSPFQAVVHALTTLSSGGFSTEATSLAGFSAYSQWVVIVFMVMAGISFTLHYRAVRDPRAYLGSSELRLYLTIMAAAAAIIAVGTWGDGAAAEVIRDAVFTATSIVTTTGFVSTDYARWSAALQILILGLMFVGGMAGSTSGSVKPYRLGVLFGASRNDVRRVVHPRGVFVVRLGRTVVPEPVVEAVQSFFLLYMFTFMTATLVLGLIQSGGGIGSDLVTSASAVAASLGNVGTGLGEVGPTGNYAGIPALGKWVLSFVMIVGRLEIFPVMLLFTRELWRR